MSDLNKNYFEKITYRDALRLAMHDAMQEDKNIIIMGEDVANYGGAYGATKDLGYIKDAYTRPFFKYASKTK